MTFSSKLTCHQTITYGPKAISGYGAGGEITAAVRFDHNIFAITARVTVDRENVAGGCLHDEVVQCFPELAPFVRWHLCSTDGPFHYIENTMYWLGRRGYTRWDNERAGRETGPHAPPNLEHARKAAIWPDMPESFVITGTSVSNAIVEQALADRLPGLLAEFRAAVESLGMVW